MLSLRSMNVIGVTPTAPSIVSGTTTNLRAPASDDAGENGLTYSWSATGPAAVSYSDNGTNTAKNVVATFHKAGNYNFVVTITDSAGQSTTSAVAVNVLQSGAIAISPSVVSLAPGKSIVLAAGGVDQFGNEFTGISWSIASGNGMINPTNGFYTAPTTTGTVVIKATAGASSKTTSLTITNAISVPSGFSDGDIGAPAKAGWAWDKNGTTTVTGGGTGFSRTSDQFNFLRTISGNPQIMVTQVASLASSGSTPAAGLMFRTSTDANSIFAAVTATPTSVAFSSRATTGGAVTSVAIPLNALSLTQPLWVGLLDILNTVVAAYSTDGNTWHPIAAARILPIGNKFLGGYVVSALSSSAVATAVFRPYIPTLNSTFQPSAAAPNRSVFSTVSLISDTELKRLLHAM